MGEPFWSWHLPLLCYALGQDGLARNVSVVWADVASLQVRRALLLVTKGVEFSNQNRVTSVAALLAGLLAPHAFSCTSVPFVFSTNTLACIGIWTSLWGVSGVALVHVLQRAIGCSDSILGFSLHGCVEERSLS